MLLLFTLKQLSHFNPLVYNGTSVPREVIHTYFKHQIPPGPEGIAKESPCQWESSGVLKSLLLALLPSQATHQGRTSIRDKSIAFWLILALVVKEDIKGDLDTFASLSTTPAQAVSSSCLAQLRIKPHVHFCAVSITNKALREPFGCAKADSLKKPFCHHNQQLWPTLY